MFLAVPISLSQKDDNKHINTKKKNIFGLNPIRVGGRGGPQDRIARRAHFDPFWVKIERLYFLTFSNYTLRPFKDDINIGKQNYLRGQTKFRTFLR